MNYEFSKNYTVDALGRKAMISGISKSLGANPITSGVGVQPGKYKFITPPTALIFGCKPVDSTKGKFNLTFVAGTLCGIETDNKSIEKTFDLEKQLFVIPLNDWEKILPNQRYEVLINDRGRVATLAILSNTDIVNSSEVVITANSLETAAI